MVAKTRTTRPDDLEPDMVELLRMQPGYDPFAGADGYWFDIEKATRACSFFPQFLRHGEGEMAGQPFELEPWQLSIIANLFGWYGMDEYGRESRRYREAYLLVARKNGKTPLAAGICNFVLFAEGEQGAQIYSAAATANQAALLHRHASEQVLQEPALNRRAKIYHNFAQREIRNTQTRGVYRVLSSDGKNQHGLNPTLVIVDELHAITKSDFIDALATAGASKNRRHPLLVFITTADAEGDSVCNRKYDYACRVRDGEVHDPQFLPALYEADADDDIHDPATWSKANPNLDVSVSRDYLRRESNRCRDLPSERLAFQQFHLNVQVKSNMQWLSMPAWDECKSGLQPADLYGEECYAGLDVSTRKDLTSLVLFFPESKSVLGWHWCPDVICDKRERLNSGRFRAWARSGHLIATPGDSTSYADIHRKILELSELYQVRQVAFDPWNAAQLAQELMQDGIDMVEFGQTIRNLNEPCKAVETMVTARELRHNGDPVMRWAAGNVVIFMDSSGNIRPEKAKSRDKIDPIVALIMAVGRATFDMGPAASVYEERGVIEI